MIELFYVILVKINDINNTMKFCHSRADGNLVIDGGRSPPTRGWQIQEQFPSRTNSRNKFFIKNINIINDKFFSCNRRKSILDWRSTFYYIHMNSIRSFLKMKIADSRKCHRQTLLFMLLFSVVVMSQAQALGLPSVLTTDSVEASYVGE